MMSRTVTYDYLPSEEGPRATWLNTFAERLPNYATTLGVSSADVNYVIAGAAAYNYAVFSLSILLRNLSRAVTLFKDNFEGDRTPDPLAYPVLTLPQPPTAPSGVNLKTGLFIWINDLVVEIRKSPNYSQSIGTDLGLVAPPKPPVALKGRITKLEAFPGSEVDISFVRSGAKMAIIESKRGNGDWEVLDKVAASSYEDNRPPLVAGQPEVRIYRIRLSDGKNAFGDYSDEMSIGTKV